MLHFARGRSPGKMQKALANGHLPGVLPGADSPANLLSAIINTGNHKFQHILVTFRNSNMIEYLHNKKIMDLPLLKLPRVNQLYEANQLVIEHAGKLN